MERKPESYARVLVDGYRAGLISRRRIMALAAKLPAIAAALAAAGGVVAWATIENDVLHRQRRLRQDLHCALDAPPLRPPGTYDRGSRS